MGISSSLGSSALLPAGLGFRNLVINGNFAIDQRNAGASFTSANGAYGLDRWVYGATQASKTTTQRITSTIPGFVHSMKVTSTSAYTPVSNDEIEWFQRVEASQIAQLGWGTASAKPAVLSFWVKSSITGTFGGSINDGGLTYSFPFSYTVNAANTAEYKSITITPPPAGTWTSTGVGIGVHLFFSLGAAGTSLGTAGAWTAGFKNGATGQTNLVATNGATLELTGVQLEVNLQPTPFEQRPIGVELELCRRYYQRVTTTFGDMTFAAGVFFTSTTPVGSYNFSPMRAAPTFNFTNGVYDVVSNGVAPTATSVVGNNVTTTNAQLGGVCSGATAGGGLVYRLDSGFFDLSAEL
jgi:hypothetical protein